MMTVGETSTVQNYSYGYIDLQSSCENCNVVLKGGQYIYNGIVYNGASLLRLRASADNNNNISLINCEMTVSGNFGGFINGGLGNETSNCLNNFIVEGGKYTYSTNKSGNFGPFEVTFKNAIFKNVEVITDNGPIIEHFGYGEEPSLTIIDCSFKHPTNGTWGATGVATSKGRELTIESGNYAGNQAVYVYSSGGIINILDGNYLGTSAVMQADGAQNNESVINVSNGTFNGKIFANGGTEDAYIYINGGNFINVSFVTNGANSHIVITGGTFDADPTAYVAEGYTVTESNGTTWTVVKAN